MSEELRFGTDNTVEDWQAFLNYCTAAARAEHAPAARRLGFAVMGAAVLLGLAAGYFGLARSLDARTLAVGFAFLMVLWGVALWGERRRRRAAVAALQPRPGGSFLRHYDFALGSDALRVSGQHSESRMDWTLVRDVIETDAHLFILLDTSQGLVVPKRSLVSPTPSELRDFIVLRKLHAGAGATGAS